MTRACTNDLDYLASRLHARRSRMAERSRLDELCRARSVPELARAIFPAAETASASHFQRRLVQNLANEITGCLKHLAGENQSVVAWLLTRFQIENAKILLRGLLSHASAEHLQWHLVSLPAEYALDASLPASKSLGEFVRRLPSSCPRKRLQALIGSRTEPAALLLEAALDAGYFQELLERTGRLSTSECEIARPLVMQEINLFQFMLAIRGRFDFGMHADTFSPFRVAGAGGSWLNAVGAASDISSAAKSAVGMVLDTLPAAEFITPAALETLAWQRYLRLANNTFRRSHNGIAAVVGYFGVRRVEIANLTTLSEGIRLGAGERELRERLLPRTNLEATHV